MQGGTEAAEEAEPAAGAARLAQALAGVEGEELADCLGALLGAPGGPGGSARFDALIGAALRALRHPPEPGWREPAAAALDRLGPLREAAAADQPELLEPQVRMLLAEATLAALLPGRSDWRAQRLDQASAVLGRCVRALGDAAGEAEAMVSAARASLDDPDLAMTLRYRIPARAMVDDGAGGVRRGFVGDEAARRAMEARLAAALQRAMARRAEQARLRDLAALLGQEVLRLRGDPAG